MVYRFFGVGLLLLSSVLPAEVDRKRVRVGGGYSVPWAYLGPDGTPTGFYVEVMKEAARREGLAFEAVFRKDGPERALRSGEIDLWSAAAPTAERRKTLHFSQPWWSQDHYFGVLASGPVYGLNDLAGRTVVHGTSPPFTTDLREALPGAVLQPMADLRSRFTAVCEGEADAVLFYHETSLFAVTGSNEMAECRERGLRLIPLGRPVMEISVAALLENRALAERFRGRIGEMTRDSTLARLASFPLTGNENLNKMLQAQQTQHRQRQLEISVGFLALVLVLGGAAHVRLRRANQRTGNALEAAEKALRAKSEFLAMMSHEIRTPMTAVVGYMDMLMGTPLRHDQRRFATEVTQATEALLTLVTTLLGYARPERAAIPEDETLNPAAVMDDCVAAVQLEAEEKGLALTVEVDRSVPRRLRGDAVRLRQAVLNLLNNAVKFTPRGWVRVWVSYGEGALTCVVSDSGEGIPEDRRTMIFEPFTQLDSTDKRRYGGVGLGLAVVADICRQLNGEVRVDGEAGGGAKFTLRIPYGTLEGEPSWLPAGAEGTAAVLATEGTAVEIFDSYLRWSGMDVERFSTWDGMNEWAAPERGRVLCFVAGEAFGTAVPPWRNDRTTMVLMGSMGYLREVSEERKEAYDDVLPMPAAARSVREILYPAATRSVRERVPVRRHVLVVDDNAVNRRVLTALLEKLGCRVDTAKNGREAVEASMREPYAAILMDCQMPVMNGYEATAEIRRHPLSGGDVPICGVSASLDAETRKRCEASGMTEYMPKPVTLGMLQDLLTRVTARQIIVENLQDGG
ncbi:MAG: ATP-binding protein [Bryobacteraceae bacterium]